MVWFDESNHILKVFGKKCYTLVAKIGVKTAK